MPSKTVLEAMLATPEQLRSEYLLIQVSGAFLETCCCTELFRHFLSLGTVVVSVAADLDALEA